MNIPNKLKPIVYGLIVFIIFIALSTSLKLLTHRVNPADIYFGILSNKDLLIGLFVAVLVTFTHEKKKTLK